MSVQSGYLLLRMESSGSREILGGRSRTCCVSMFARGSDQSTVVIPNGRRPGLPQPAQDQLILSRRLAVGGGAVSRHLARVVDVVLMATGTPSSGASSPLASRSSSIAGTRLPVESGAGEGRRRHF
jgi:hypothetical protein